MKVIIDLDDTLSKTEDRDYEHSQPIQSVIDKLGEMRETFNDVEVVLHTARGMNSCKGDVKMAEKKNRPAIERFLQRYGIKVDRIIFGKPLGDLYIDDKAMAAHDFAASTIESYRGLSGASRLKLTELPFLPFIVCSLESYICSTFRVHQRAGKWIFEYLGAS